MRIDIHTRESDLVSSSLQALYTLELQLHNSNHLLTDADYTNALRHQRPDTDNVLQAHFEEDFMR